MEKLNDLTLEDLDLLDFSDPEVQSLVAVLEKEDKYNTRLTDFFDIAYDWQKDAWNNLETHKISGLLCGNQMGKTEAGCAIVAAHLTGIYPEWYTGPRFDFAPKIMCAGESWEHNKANLQEKLFGDPNKRLDDEIGTGFIPRHLINFKSITTERGDEIKTCRIKHNSGKESQLIFRAYSQGRKAAQGFQSDFILIDEQPADDFWGEALVRTAATGGKIMCTFTPLDGGEVWLVDEFMNLEDIEGAPFDDIGVKRKSDGEWALVRASWWDTNDTHMPNKEKLIRSIPEYERATRVYGMPLAGKGAVYPFLESEITYDPREIVFGGNTKHLIGIDIGNGGNGDYSAVVAIAHHEEKYYVYAEWEGLTNTSEELASKIWSINPNIDVVWPPDAGKTSINANSSTADQLRDLNVNLKAKPFLNPRGADGKTNNHIAPGVAIINQMFHLGQLKISTKCTILLSALSKYSYDKTGKFKDLSKRRGQDVLDAFRYVTVSAERHAKVLGTKRFNKFTKREVQNKFINRY